MVGHGPIIGFSMLEGYEYYDVNNVSNNNDNNNIYSMDNMLLKQLILLN